MYNVFHLVLMLVISCEYACSLHLSTMTSGLLCGLVAAVSSQQSLPISGLLGAAFLLFCNHSLTSICQQFLKPVLVLYLLEYVFSFSSLNMSSM